MRIDWCTREAHISLESKGFDKKTRFGEWGVFCGHHCSLKKNSLCNLSQTPEGSELNEMTFYCERNFVVSPKKNSFNENLQKKASKKKLPLAEIASREHIRPKRLNANFVSENCGFKLLKIQFSILVHVRLVEASFNHTKKPNQEKTGKILTKVLSRPCLSMERAVSDSYLLDS